MSNLFVVGIGSFARSRVDQVRTRAYHAIHGNADRIGTNADRIGTNDALSYEALNATVRYWALKNQSRHSTALYLAGRPISSMVRKVEYSH